MAAGGGGWDTTGFTYSSSACTCYPPYCRCREPKPEPVKCPDCGAWFVNEHRCQHVLSADCWCEPRVEQVPPA